MGGCWEGMGGSSPPRARTAVRHSAETEEALDLVGLRAGCQHQAGGRPSPIVVTTEVVMTGWNQSAARWGSPGLTSSPQHVQRSSRRHDDDSFVLPQREEVLVSGHQHLRAPSDGRGEHHVVIRVTYDARDSSGVVDQVGKGHEVDEPQVDFLRAQDIPLDARESESPFHLGDNGWREHEVEGVSPKEVGDDLPRRAARTNHGTDEHVGVEQDPGQRSPARSRPAAHLVSELPARCALGLEGEVHRLVVGQPIAGALRLAVEHGQGVRASEPPHLLEALDRDQGRHRLALALDDELVLPQGDTVEKVTDALANVQSGHGLGHGRLPSQPL